jgi:N-acetylglucosaminyldiphosphoundecaprenol N-acetyl-beta-D-mannosaminyltransferase
MTELLPRAPLAAVLGGRAPLVGSRLDPSAPRGFVSPIEARVHLGIPYGDLAREERDRIEASDEILGVLLRAAVSRLLAGDGEASTGRPFIVATHVDALTIDEALDRLIAPGPEERARVVHFVHPHALNLAAGDAELRDHLARADLVLPDGVGLRLAGRILGAALPHNLNGTDLLPLLCERLAAIGRPLCLVGAGPGVAEACARAFARLTPGLRVALVSHGFLSDGESRGIAASIARLRAPLVLVGMGTPLQERWAWRYLARLQGATVVTVGGLFDFYSGRIPRAPAALRELGIEWIWRLAQEPGRMFKRYVVGNPAFLLRVLEQRVRIARGA